MKTALLVFLALAGNALAAWQDPSSHSSQFVTVDDNVKLEILDWGGSGVPVVLLAGLGNTAHVFDGFAEKLSALGHVYGITRRGYGASSRPPSGYGQKRLAQDVLQVLDSLKLVQPILMGHSIAGDELTEIGVRHSDRIAGLIYLDALADPTDDYTGYDTLRKNLPEVMRILASPSVADRASFAAYREWQRRTSGAPFPESELHNDFRENPDGSVGPFGTPDRVAAAIRAGGEKRDYSLIRVPVLAFTWFPLSTAGQMRKYHITETGLRAAIEAVHTAEVRITEARIRAIQRAAGSTHVVKLPDANHFLFLSNEGEVLQETRSFVRSIAMPVARAADVAAFAGVWRAHEGDLPTVTITVTDEGGTLVGAVLFYLIRREPGQPATASRGVPEPLLDPQIDGDTLRFQVSHRRAHPPRTLADPPVTMRLQLTGSGTGMLSVEGSRIPPIQVTRTGY